jgi:CHASE2 domain-containing sensor protein
MSFLDELKKLVGLKQFQSRYEKRFINEWVLTTLITVFILALFSSWHVVSSVGNIFYDQIQQRQKVAVHQDILIVGLDDKSIAELGGWPLSRNHYAQLLKKLADEQNAPKRIGFDVLFLDPKPEDKVFAEQLKRHHVILPVEFRYDEESQSELGVYPVSPIKEAVDGFGHIQITYDQDGVIRGSQLQANGAFHFSAMMADQSVAKGYKRFSMLDPAHAYPIISLSDALSDHFNRSIFKDKYVLIGAVAPSLGDRYPTVFSGKNDAGTPGVQINADLLSAILDGKLIYPTEDYQVFFFGLVGLLAILLGLLNLSPAGEMISTLVVVTFLLLFTYLALTFNSIWINPLPAIVTIVLVKPVWAWRRMEMMVHFMQDKTSSLQVSSEAQNVTPVPTSSKASFIQYTQMLGEAIELASERLNFLALVISEIPEAVLITDDAGMVMRHNQQMESVFESADLRKGQSIDWLFKKLKVFSSERLEELMHCTYVEERFAAHDKMGALREFRMRIIPLPITPTSHWRLMMMVDITDLVNLQKQRDRTLAILTHDMRTPVASILATLRQDNKGQSLDSNQSESIHKHAHFLLKMMDDFILSIRAEAEQYRLEETLFETLLDEALYQIKELMQSRQMRIDIDASELPAFVQVDSRLMTRVIVNLLGNAIRYGAAGTQVTLLVENIQVSQHSKVQLTISNFVGDQQHQEHESPENKGFGMGLEFIRTVIKKHQGTFQQHISAKPGEIAQVIITLPSISI